MKALATKLIKFGKANAACGNQSNSASKLHDEGEHYVCDNCETLFQINEKNVGGMHSIGLTMCNTCWSAFRMVSKAQKDRGLTPS